MVESGQEILCRSGDTYRSVLCHELVYNAVVC